jgi:hypothetical protein
MGATQSPIDQLLKVVETQSTTDAKMAKMAPHLKAMGAMAKAVHGHGAAMGKCLNKAMECHGSLMKAAGDLLGGDHEPSDDSIKHDLDTDNEHGTEFGEGMADSIHPEPGSAPRKGEKAAGNGDLAKSILTGVSTEIAKLSKGYDARMENVETAVDTLHKGFNALLRSMAGEEPVTAGKESQVSKVTVTAGAGKTDKATPVERSAGPVEITHEEIEMAKSDPRKQRDLFLKIPSKRMNGPTPQQRQAVADASVR